jgi:hypothetical protein
MPSGWSPEAVPPTPGPRDDAMMSASRSQAPGMRGRATPADDRYGDQVTTVDCDRCRVRGDGCGDCVVTFLLGGPPPDARLSSDERHALDVLSDAGLIPPLRMVEVLDRDPEPPSAGS